MYNELPPHICPLTLKICTEKKCITVTSVQDAKATESMSMCEKCGTDFLKQLDQPVTQPVVPSVPEVTIAIDPKNITGDQLITVITTAEQLMDVFSGKGIQVNLPPPRDPCPQCGLSVDDFNKVGRFGCAYCYTHYLEEFLALAGPFQNGADEHKGKRPKPKLNLVEEIQLVKLKIAHALEMEKYEEINPLKQELVRLEQLQAEQGVE